MIWKFDEPKIWFIYCHFWISDLVSRRIPNLKGLMILSMLNADLYSGNIFIFYMILAGHLNTCIVWEH